MKKKIFTIGRDESCDIVIPDKTDVTSRLHATLRVESNKKIYITDQSRNGTYVNGIKMSSNVEIPITRGDVVSFAHIYNLDWNLIPKSKKNLYVWLFCSLGFVCCLLVLFFLYLKKNQQTVAPVEDQASEQIIKPSFPIDAEVQKDTVVVRDTVFLRRQEKTKVVEKQKTKPEKKVEKEEEVIYNPIY